MFPEVLFKVYPLNINAFGCVNNKVTPWAFATPHLALNLYIVYVIPFKTHFSFPLWIDIDCTTKTRGATGIF